MPAEGLESSVLCQQDLLASPNAEGHFTFYRNSLDPLIHYILTESDSFSSLRSRSQFLAVAICSVGAHCTGAPDRSEWLELFRNLVGARTFAKQHAFDDVRALCIGAFWLSDLATALSALGRYPLVSSCTRD